MELRCTPGSLETHRLALIPLPLEAYELLLNDRREEVERMVGLRLDASRLVDLAPIVRFRYDQLQRDPSEVSWLIHLIRLRGRSTVVGDIGFHAPPDENGMVEIGYTIIEPYRRQGIASEAARGMAAWASKQPGVRTLRASVSPGNEPSLRLAGRLGLIEVGRQMDEIDGEEIVFEAPLPLSE